MIDLLVLGRIGFPMKIFSILLFLFSASISQGAETTDEQLREIVRKGFDEAKRGVNTWKSLEDQMSNLLITLFATNRRLQAEVAKNQAAVMEQMQKQQDQTADAMKVMEKEAKVYRDQEIHVIVMDILISIKTADGLISGLKLTAEMTEDQRKENKEIIDDLIGSSLILLCWDEPSLRTKWSRFTQVELEANQDGLASWIKLQELNDEIQSLVESLGMTEDQKKRWGAEFQARKVIRTGK